jgi:CheY-like chemotaxis protein
MPLASNGFVDLVPATLWLQRLQATILNSGCGESGSIESNSSLFPLALGNREMQRASIRAPRVRWSAVPRSPVEQHSRLEDGQERPAGAGDPPERQREGSAFGDTSRLPTNRASSFDHQSSRRRPAAPKPPPRVLVRSASLLWVKERRCDQMRHTTILVVDDEHIITDTMVMILNREFLAIGCYSAAEAIGIVRGILPDLVLLDVIMPNVNACARIAGRVWLQGVDDERTSRRRHRRAASGSGAAEAEGVRNTGQADPPRRVDREDSRIVEFLRRRSAGRFDDVAAASASKSYRLHFDCSTA